MKTDFRTGMLAAEDLRVLRSTKTLGELRGVFLEEHKRMSLDPATPVYSVEYWKPVAEGTEGGLYWGNSTVYPGTVGSEFFMTRGHFHAVRNRAEYYATISGNGLLVMMDATRHATVEEMRAGSTHYIPGETAHRVVNTGNLPLTFLACWPSDAGYDYTTIEKQGFSIRVLQQDGGVVLVAQP